MARIVDGRNPGRLQALVVRISKNNNLVPDMLAWSPEKGWALVSDNALNDDRFSILPAYEERFEWAFEVILEHGQTVGISPEDSRYIALLPCGEHLPIEFYDERAGIPWRGLRNAPR